MQNGDDVTECLKQNEDIYKESIIPSNMFIIIGCVVCLIVVGGIGIVVLIKKKK